MPIRITKGDITTIDVDAIVNAANEQMLGGGGVDGAIHRAAGPQLVAACRAVAEVRPGIRCPTGEARITPGFKLRARYVIHTVGPVYQDGHHGEPALLASCYRNSLQLAADNGIRSIAFPAISCGIFGYPFDDAARIAVHEVSKFLETHPALEAQLVAFSTQLGHSLSAALAAPRTDGETLTLVQRDTRAKYHLAGRPVSGGDPIDLCFSGGWVTGRFEWNGDIHERPAFHYSIELLSEGRVAQGQLEIPDGAILRWPGSGS